MLGTAAENCRLYIYLLSYLFQGLDLMNICATPRPEEGSCHAPSALATVIVAPLGRVFASHIAMCMEVILTGEVPHQG